MSPFPSNLLQTARQISEQCVGQERDILGHLDELGDLMTDMLDRQQNVEVSYLCSMPIPPSLNKR